MGLIIKAWNKKMSSKQAKSMRHILQITKQKILDGCNEDDYLTCQEIADRLNLNIGCVVAHARKPDFPTSKIAMYGEKKFRFYHVDEVDKWFRKNTHHKPSPRKLIQQFYQVLHDARQNNEFA